jgi:hypothetical protein
MPPSSSSAQTLGSTRGRSRSPTRRVNGSILTRVDPRTVDVVDRIDVHAPLDDVTVGSGAVWATSGPASSALRLDREGRVTFRIPIASKPGAESPYPFAVATGAGSIWVQGYGGLRRGRSGLVDRQRDVRPMPGHGLTHAGPGTAADEPGSYYPRRVRNFARVMAADDVQGAANAQLARALGAKRVFAIRDGGSYGDGVAAAFHVCCAASRVDCVHGAVEV